MISTASAHVHGVTMNNMCARITILRASMLHSVICIPFDGAFVTRQGFCTLYTLDYKCTLNLGNNYRKHATNAYAPAHSILACHLAVPFILLICTRLWRLKQNDLAVSHDEDIIGRPSSMTWYSRNNLALTQPQSMFSSKLVMTLLFIIKQRFD